MGADVVDSTNQTAPDEGGSKSLGQGVGNAR